MSSVVFLFPEGVSLVCLLVMYHASFTLSLKTVFEDSLYLVHFNCEVKFLVILSIGLIVSSSW